MVAEADQADAAAASDLQVRDRRVVAAQPEPRLGRQLQCSHHEEADDVHVRNNDLILVPGQVVLCCSRRWRLLGRQPAVEKRPW